MFDKTCLRLIRFHSAVATIGPCPLTADCAPLPFWFTQNIVFRKSRNDKTTANDGKRNDYVQT